MQSARKEWIDSLSEGDYVVTNHWVFDLADHPDQRTPPGAVFQLLEVHAEEDRYVVVDPMTGRENGTSVDNFDPPKNVEGSKVPEVRKKLQELEEGDPVWIKSQDDLYATRIKTIQYGHLPYNFDEEDAPKGYFSAEDGTVISMFTGTGCVSGVECYTTEEIDKDWAEHYAHETLVRDLGRYDWSEASQETLREVADIVGL